MWEFDGFFESFFRYCGTTLESRFTDMVPRSKNSVEVTLDRRG